MKLEGLYAITPEHPDPGLPLHHQVEQAILGGARIVQYRDKSDDSRQHSAKKLYQSGANKISYALHVRHDSGHQFSGLAVIEEVYRQSDDVLLDFCAQK